MSEPRPKGESLEFLEEALKSEAKAVSIRLREGEYQFGLASTIASFELELHFPDVRDIVKKLFGQKKTDDQQFLNMIQTILKKMEKSGVIKILPKEKPWELQRYMLSSFKFQDVEKNIIAFATNSDVDKTLELIHTQPTLKSISANQPAHMTIWIPILILLVIGSYGTIIWFLSQAIINLIMFGLAFSVAAISSILLGILISRKS